MGSLPTKATESMPRLTVTRHVETLATHENLPTEGSLMLTVNGETIDQAHIDAEFQQNLTVLRAVKLEYVRAAS